MITRGASVYSCFRNIAHLLLTVVLLAGSIPATQPPPAEQAAASSTEPVFGEILPIDPTGAETTGDVPATSPTDGTEVSAQRTQNSATFDLGDGRYALVQGTQPMYYLDQDKQWQPIDPAFVAAENGWVNATNALYTGLAPRSSKASIRLEQSGVGWEPQQLRVLNASGDPTPLASPLPDAQAVTGTLSADGSTVVYPHSWSDAALRDQWNSGYGRAEYSLRLAALPQAAPKEAAGEHLELRVLLHLSPGTQVQVDGRAVNPQELPLETSGELAFVNGEGETLWLQPPQAYEEQNDAASVAGSYTLAAAGDNDDALELGVRIPYVWLAAAERQYPVVLDPVFQMRTGSVIRRAKYYHNGTFMANDTPATPGVGAYSDASLRLMVKFNLPQMPTGTTIEHAYMVLAPTGENLSKRNYLKASLVAYTLTDSTWVSSDTAEPQFDTTELPTVGDNVIAFSGGNQGGGLDKVVWDVTTQAQAWLPTTLASSVTNHGLIVRQATEFCTDWKRYDCGGFSIEDQYTDEDFRAIEDYYTGKTSEYTDPPRGGLRLVVIFSGPSLDEGDVFTGILGGLANPPGDDPYYNVEHEYRLQGLPSDRWQAVVARGLGETFGPNPPTQYNDPYGRTMTGNVPLEIYDTLDNKLPLDRASDVGMSYVMLNGRGAAGQTYRLRVTPNNNAPTDGYDIRLLGENGNITVAANNSVAYNLTFDTHDPLAFWNVDVPAGSKTRIDIDILDHNHNGAGGAIISETYDYAKYFAGKLYQSDQAYRGMGDVFRNVESNASQEDTGITYGSVRLTSGTFVAGSAPYALALGYFGPEITIWSCIISTGEFCTSQVAPLEFDYRVRVTACTGNTFPTRDGTCQEIRCPSTGFPAAGRIPDVGGLQLWSENGWTAGENNDGPAPLIGGTGDVVPTVAVVGGKINYSGSSFTIDADNEVFLVNCGSTLQATPPAVGNNFFSAHVGAMQNAGSGSSARIEKTGGVNMFNPWNEHDIVISGGAEPHVYPITGEVRDTVTLRRKTGNDIDFSVTYATDYRGWPMLSSSVVQVGTTDPPPVAGTLLLDLGEAFSMDTTAAGGKDQVRSFEVVRAVEATITQPENLGGASKPVQAVLMREGQSVNGVPDISCKDDGEGCVDLRGPDDTAADRLNPKREWQMPDVHIAGAPGMVVMSTPGDLQVYSTDHPNGLAVTAPQDVGAQYSFDTFGAGVTIGMEACAPGEDPVPVILGATRMTMPNIGDSGNPDSVIDATFKLCESNLREVSFQFQSPVGVPIGSSGLFVTGMRGKVTLTPNYTQITFGLDFQAAQGGNGGVFKGSGDVLIDTRGYFEFDGDGKILGKLNATGKLWVAWSPLDMGFEMSVGYSNWLTGSARAHMWEGQGWQHRYPWLPDNDEKHIAAQIAATISIEQGAAFSWWFIDIPPDDMSFGVEVSFGQFCTNSSCSAYEWGVKGKFSVVGYDVGLYYGFDKGFDFILGNDGHVLIDQYASSAAARATLAEGTARGLNIRQASLAVNGVATETFTVSPYAESVLFAIGWQSGAPQVTILDRDGTDVTTSSDYVVAISETATSRLIGVQIDPPTLSGEWHAVISNLTGQEHYKFTVFASKGAPGRNGSGHFITPATWGGDDATGAYTITWSIPAEAPTSTTISLIAMEGFYQDGYWYLRDKEITIVKNWPFRSGMYVWDTSWMATTKYTTQYQIRAIVDDGINELPAESVRESDDPCVPRNELPSVRAFDEDRFPGLSTFVSPGTVKIQDSVPPATPTGLTLKGVDGAILARWDPSPEKDLSGYLVRWGTRMLLGGNETWLSYNETRIPATEAPSVRLGGLINGGPGALSVYGVWVKAVDASDNVGPATTVLHAVPTADAMEQVPSSPGTPVVDGITSTCVAAKCTSSATLSWTAGSGPVPASYRVIYTRLAPNPSVAYTETGTATVTLPLETAATYSVTVSAANSEGWRSAPSDGVRFVVTDGTDSDGDTLPDDWEAVFGAGQNLLPDDDDDHDGRTNRYEYAGQTLPLQQDSDDDGFSDWEEQQQGSDPLDALSYPAEPLQPRLDLSRHNLVFRVKKGEANPGGQWVFYDNAGGGTLNLATTTTGDWISSTLETLWLPPTVKRYVNVSIDAGDLAPGYHTDVIRLGPGTGSGLFIGEQQCVRVEVWVSPEDSSIPDRYIYLPLIMR